jgi:hypothetical protein
MTASYLWTALLGLSLIVLPVAWCWAFILCAFRRYVSGLRLGGAAFFLATFYMGSRPTISHERETTIMLLAVGSFLCLGLAAVIEQLKKPERDSSL